MACCFLIIYLCASKTLTERDTCPNTERYNCTGLKLKGKACLSLSYKLQSSEPAGQSVHLLVYRGHSQKIRVDLMIPIWVCLAHS